MDGWMDGWKEACQLYIHTLRSLKLVACVLMKRVSFDRLKYNSLVPQKNIISTSKVFMQWESQAKKLKVETKSDFHSSILYRS